MCLESRKNVGGVCGRGLSTTKYTNFQGITLKSYPELVMYTT